MSSSKHQIQFVRLGFGDLFGLAGRSLYFTSDELDTKSAQEVVRVIKEYGSFRGEKVAWAIGEIEKVWRSKDHEISFRFGREYFPVLYVKLPFLGSRAYGPRVLKSREILKVTEPAEIKVDEYRDGLKAWWRTAVVGIKIDS